MTTARLTQAPDLRILARVDHSDPAACWIWKGSTRGRGEHKYGNMTTGSRTDGTRRTRSTHTVMYEAAFGPVPEGMELDHTCRNKLCCNPAHLEPVTHQVNQARKPTEVRASVAQAMTTARRSAAAARRAA